MESSMIVKGFLLVAPSKKQSYKEKETFFMERSILLGHYLHEGRPNKMNCIYSAHHFMILNIVDI